jgi:hypothetical protein
MQVGWPDLVYYTNFSLTAAAFLTVILWQVAKGAAARRRAVGLSTFLLCAALWSYAWYFRPLPPYLSGLVDETGYCRQTTYDSCSAAAAAMLLASHGIQTDEQEMADLCLTRAGAGTTPLGLFRGISLKAIDKRLRPAPVFVREVADLSRLGGACITTVGLRNGAPPEVEERMLSYGWEHDVRHDIVIFAVDPAGEWMDVGDPSFGRERWPTHDLEYIWDKRVLILEPR